jgi:hypothetical protein
MKIIALINAALLLGAATQSMAQNAIQTITFTLTAYNQPTPTITRLIRITNKDIINYFAGTNIAGAQLSLVTPVASGVLTNTGNMNAYLSITKGKNDLLDVPTPDSFNLFQDAVATSQQGSVTTAIGTDRFSIAFGNFQAELQGFTTWTTAKNGGRTLFPVFSAGSPSANATGAGSFTSTVSGEGTIDGVTNGSAPMQGTVTGSTPTLQQ